MRSTPELDAKAGLTKLATYPYQIATWVEPDFEAVMQLQRNAPVTGRL